MALAVMTHAKDQIVLFDTEDTGVSKAVSLWGLDTAWLSEDNVRRGVAFMGQPQVDVVRFSFTGDWPSTNGTLHASAQAEFDQRMSIVDNYTDSHTALYLNSDTVALDSYYDNGDGVNPDTWAELIDLTRQECEDAGRTVLAVAPFNEPDDGTWQGNVNRLGDVCWRLRNTYGANFSGINICGASTLNTDTANSWYNTLNGWGYVEEGCTHQLAGSFNNYASFFQNVEANGDVGVNDEFHNVMEAMVGAEYGLGVGIWWGSAERARSEFVKASDGVRLAYAEHRGNWTAASVYRGTNGAVQAFIGESERQALPTTYRFFSKDRPVFYDGHGPQRAYSVTTTGGSGYQTADHHNAERVVNITWGDDVQPVVDGRYYLINRNSHLAMTVENAYTHNGAYIRQRNFTGGTHQQWDMNPMPLIIGGDYSYFSLTAVHSGKAADLYNFNLNDGGDVRQWEVGGTYGGANQQWFLDYVEDGWFYIRSRWSAKYLEVAGASTTDYANIQLWSSDADGSDYHRQWRLIPVGAAVEFSAPAAPTGLNATASQVSVALSWNANVETDLEGYTVLRSTTSGGPYNIIARGLTDTSFVDNSANLPMTYYYVVRAADESLNTSGNSGEMSAAPSGNLDLIAYYAFDGDLNDGSGNANHAATNGSLSFAAGKYGSGSLNLSGSDQYAVIPAEMMAGVSDFTISVWVYWNGGGAWQRIFDFGNNTTQYMFLSPSSGSGTLRFAVTTNGSGSEQIAETSSLSTGSWQHVAVTRSGNTVRLYKNGSLADTETVSIAPSSFNPVLNYIGESQWPDPLFSGRLDEMYIYNYALSDSEVMDLMNDQLPPSTDPASISVSVTNGWVDLSWPEEHIGWRLQECHSLTNASWVDVSGAETTNAVLVPFGASNSIFFRMVYP